MNATFRRALPLLRLATKAVEFMPSPGDGFLRSVVKGFALLDAAAQVYGGSHSEIRSLVDRYALQEHESEVFVALFFRSKLRERFAVQRRMVSDYEELIEAVADDGERLFFREITWGSVRVHRTFHATPGFDFTAAVDDLWREHMDGLYLSVTTRGDDKETLICEMPRVAIEHLSDAAQERLVAALRRHKQFAADGVHRCYLAYGPPGTGKSSFAALFALGVGGRALKLDATSLPVLDPRELGFLLDALKPSVLVIDDVDRAPVKETAARVLFLLERLKTTHASVAVMLTANDTSKLDPALLRCGRVDIPIAFDAPDDAETAQMVTRLLGVHGVEAAPELVQRIVAETSREQLTHAYLGDLCRRLRHESLDDVLESVSTLKRLATAATSAGMDK